jgi:hypothetical protein
MNVLLTTPVTVQVVHQRFPSGHPWQVVVAGELVARCSTYREGVEALVKYITKEDCIPADQSREAAVANRAVNRGNESAGTR